MNEDILRKYKSYLRQEHGKENTIKAYYDGIKHYSKYVKKPLNETTIKDLRKWKERIVKTYEQNTVRIWLFGVTKFYKWIGKKRIKVSIPAQVRAYRKPFSVEEKNRFLETAKEDPLDNLVALGLYDEILRPSELISIRLSDIDFDNHMLYLRDSKIGNTSVPMSPRFEQAVIDYLKVRDKPKDKFKDYLIINTMGKNKGGKILSTSIIRRVTKRTALRTGINRTVTPYKTIKPSAITLRLNDKVNPRTVQRIARHRDIKTTLIYDHSDDKDALEYLRTQEHQFNDYSKLPNKAKAQILLEKLFNGEIDNSTFNAGIELLRQDNNHDGVLDGYA
ncbi:MAG: putative tyrosine recombinase XerC-like protein [Candidatus Heimdallarchaeota archaeon AB_125]|nr:MAG: putative tyrosine recombinase XerC-like protein [Candidatus Heimdallarchaeota archaeon AB_125]